MCLNHLLENAQNNAHITIFFISYYVALDNNFEESNSYFSKIRLQTADIFMLKDVKTQSFCYFTYILTSFYIKISPVKSNFIN